MFLRFAFAFFFTAVRCVFAAAPTDFFSASDWNDGKAEFLFYQVTRPYLGKTLTEEPVWITEAGFYRPASGEFSAGRNTDAIGVLRAALRRPGEAESIPVSALAVIDWDRKNPETQWWQTVSLQGLHDGHWRALALQEGHVTLRVESTGGEPIRIQDDLKPPLLTEEMLFTHLRALPQTRGYSEDIWLLDSQLADHPAYKSQYAKIEVEGGTVKVRELNTCLIRVICADGKILEFWLHREGLHPVVQARLDDGSEWTLLRWERKKYPSF